MPEKRIWGLLQRFGVVFGVMVGVVTIFALIITGLRSEKAQIAAQILACDELTAYHPELEARFTYAGEEVKQLWKLKLKFINSGDKTIIGVGNQKNILGDGLTFVFPEETRILNIQEESEPFDSTIVQQEQNRLQIQLEQWRPGEYVIYSCYLASDKFLEKPPCPAVPTREIIDGDVVIQDLTEMRPREGMSLIDRFPTVISTPGKVIGGICAGALALSCIGILAWAWIDTIKRLMWQRRYLPSFLNYLDQVEPQISKVRKGKYRRAPETSPKELWVGFEGKKASWSMDFGGISAGIIVTVIFMFPLFGFLCLLIMLFPA